MAAYKTATVADKAALDTWIAAHNYADIQQIVWNGTGYLILYVERPNPTGVMADQVNTR